jgi:two-component system, NtrC family, sensor kinase
MDVLMDMAEDYVTLKTETYESLQRELSDLRQYVAQLEQQVTEKQSGLNLLSEETASKCGQATEALNLLTEIAEYGEEERVIQFDRVVDQLRQEVASRKQVEAALRTSEERMRTILTAVPDMLFLYDRDGVQLDFIPSKDWDSVIPPEEFLGKSVSEVLPLPVAQLIVSAIRSALERREMQLIEYQLELHGQLHDYEARIVTVADDKVLAIVRDISEQKAIEHDRQQAEKALKESEASNRRVLEALPDMLFRYSGEGIYLDFIASRDWRALVPPEEFLGKSVLDVLPLPVAQHILTAIQRALQINENQIIEYQLELDGEWHDYEARFVTVAEDEVLAIVRDISKQKAIERERKQNELQLRQSEAQLRQQAYDLEQALQKLQKAQLQLIQGEKMSSLGQLVAGVAHEINNPVNFIYGNLAHANDYVRDILGLLKLYQQCYANPVPDVQAEAEAIDIDFLIEDLPKLLNSMKIGADRIQKIVASLRTFSRMDETEMKPVNIHEGIDSTLMILQHRIKAKSDYPEIQVIKEYGEVPLVECYAGQLNQVFMNLLSNAIDALEEEMRKERSVGSATNDRLSPKIGIYTTIVDGDQVQICITDNGSGIPEVVQQRIFDPFFTTKPVGKGTGMGLSISHQIVTEKHHGLLQCTSQPGRTEFKIQLPIQHNDSDNK